MLENEMLNHRLDKVESDIQILYKKVNDVTLTQVQSVTKLEALKKRPSWLWDKVIIALISAICGVVVSHIF